MGSHSVIPSTMPKRIAFKISSIKSPFSNKKSLETEIKNFNNNKNSSYPKEVGLETYLTSAYGYTNKDDIIKFYYNAKSCLSSYLSKALFTQWADDNHNISDDAKKLFNEFLAVGNAKYSEIFNNIS